MNRYFKARRYIGSKDRGAIAELPTLLSATVQLFVVGRTFRRRRSTALIIAALVLTQKKGAQNYSHYLMAINFPLRGSSHRKLPLLKI